MSVQLGSKNHRGSPVSFFGELRRRNVFKVGAAYIVVAWLLILLADIVFSAASSPAWAVTFITFVLALGFPAAVLLAWTYEITPRGIRKTRHPRTPATRLRSPQNLHSRSVRRR